ncbi:MAG: RNA methyltransferase [Bacteroidales bacterium]|nr:RNA methyltransferase [Bacteroidales bacterium]
MITKNKIKYINSLKLNKFRKKYVEFVVEGPKLVEELIKSDFEISQIFATKVWISENENIINGILDVITEVNDIELKKISGFSTPNKVLAIAKIPKRKIDFSKIFSDLVFVLDDIQDPGNLGTIIRTCDWFGVRNLICSKECVDVYNPKVVQATMGSFARVNVFYVDIINFLKNLPENVSVYGATLNGTELNKIKFSSENTVIIIGNESKGIKKNIFPFIKYKIYIPHLYSSLDADNQAESLNASVSLSIILYDFKRRFVKNKFNF